MFITTPPVRELSTSVDSCKGSFKLLLASTTRPIANVQSFVHLARHEAEGAESGSCSGRVAALNHNKLITICALVMSNAGPKASVAYPALIFPRTLAYIDAPKAIRNSTFKIRQFCHAIRAVDR